MSRSSNDSAYGSWGRRKSGLFALSALTPTVSNEQEGGKSPKTLRKHRRQPSTKSVKLEHPDLPADNIDSMPKPTALESPKLRRPSIKTSIRRPPSVFGKPIVRVSTDSHDDYAGEPLSATSTSTAGSMSIGDATMETLMPDRTVVMHGEVQTSAGMFRKKKEYLVLTEAMILRFKSQAKAAEVFKSIPNAAGRSPNMRHGQIPSVGSSSDLHSVSESSGDKDGKIALRQVVAVYRLDDGKPYFAIELCYLDEESAQSSAMTLQFGHPEERDVWLKCIRRATSDVRQDDPNQISPFNLENAARIIERDHDYDPANCAIYKVVQRQSAGKSAGRSSSDDLTKSASAVCFLAIGVHKIHIIQLAKPVTRSSSPSLAPGVAQGSYGILTLTGVKLSHADDTFELTLRQPLQTSRKLYLASSASGEIAARIHFAENYLRPEFHSRLLRFSVPRHVEEMFALPVEPDSDGHSNFERTLTAYCVAYAINPSNVRYTINYNCEDAPRFELLPPADTRRSEYGPLECLAIMRSLRYNETFGSICFANIPFDALNGLHDNYGFEHVCAATKSDTPIKLTQEELRRSCLLVQEVRALAATSKRLRRMDFSGCITTKPAIPTNVLEEELNKPKDIGCGIVEALFPLCKHQTTNVDWICLNGIYLSDTDLDYLVGAAVERACHFRAIELNRCGLSDRSMGLILDALRAQDSTLEAIEIAGNPARLNPAAFDAQLGMFAFIRKLNLSYVSQTSASGPLLQAETLLIWRLSELRLSGTTLNTASVDALATYLAHPQSSSLHELYLDNAYLSGGEIATLLRSMIHGGASHRDMHLDISQSILAKDLDHVAKAIAGDMAPSHLTMRAIEYKDEAAFRKMLNAVTVNKTIQYLDMSHTALPGIASEETCRTLERMLAENDTLLDLNVSGEDSRLATSRFGPGINDALAGLKQNRTLQTFRIEKQKLGLQGSSTLSEVLKENRTLREVHCDNNEIPLQGLTDLVNSLIDNTSIVYLPTMDDGRAAAFRSADMTMKAMSDAELPVRRSSPSTRTSSTAVSSFAMKRGLASVRRTTQRTASVFAPSLPAVPGYSRSSSSPASASSSPLSMSFSLSMPQGKTRQASGSGPTAAPAGFTVQDVQSTHRLLAEQWDRQCERLAQFLDRNWCLYNDMAAGIDLPGMKAERPDSVGSLGKILAQVRYDTTPRAEPLQYFDAMPQEDQLSSSPPPLPEKSAMRIDVNGKPTLSFKQFILDSGNNSPVSEEDEMSGGLRQLRVHTDLDDPGTPTQ